ncbi:MAG: dethiobiotin synthase [Pseudomonadota bacterium]
MNGVVVAGIGTEVGKTVVSAVLVEALDADYWKPVQSGGLEHTDTMAVEALASGPGRRFHPEAYRLTQPLSPHAAARFDGVTIDPAALALPATERPLVVELAGGLMVPLSETLLNLDLLADWRLPVVLVCSYYLGSINHTLLSVQALESRGVPLAGLVLNGAGPAESRAAKLGFSGARCLLELPWPESVDAGFIRSHANRISL